MMVDELRKVLDIFFILTWHKLCLTHVVRVCIFLIIGGGTACGSSYIRFVRIFLDHHALVRIFRLCE